MPNITRFFRRIRCGLSGHRVFLLLRLVVVGYFETANSK